jgi:hypothetical protein
MSDGWTPPRHLSKPFDSGDKPVFSFHGCTSSGPRSEFNELQMYAVSAGQLHFLAHRLHLCCFGAKSSEERESRGEPERERPFTKIFEHRRAATWSE